MSMFITSQPKAAKCCDESRPACHRCVNKNKMLAPHSANQEMMDKPSRESAHEAKSDQQLNTQDAIDLANEACLGRANK